MSVNQANQGQPKTREEYKRLKLEKMRRVEQAKLEKKMLSKQAKMESKKINSDSKVDSKVKVRMIPIWLRLVILACMIILSITVGALVGYGGLGGGKATDVLKESTWTHIRDLIDKK